MNPAPDSPEGSLAKLGRIIEACGRFEAGWRAGPRPRIEDEVGVPPDPELLQRLISLELSLRAEAGERPSPGEYHGRFPSFPAAVDAAFGEQTLPPAPAVGLGPPIDPAYDLLLGILALQNGYIDHAILVKVIRLWVADKSRRVGKLLVDQGHLDAGGLILLEALVADHRKRNGDDVRKSLAAIGSIVSARKALADLADDDVQRSLSGIGEGDEHATTQTLAPFTPDSEDDPYGAFTPNGRFQVLSFHSRGNLGKVSIAKDRELRRKVAFKEIRDDKAHVPINRDQFLLEALFTGGLEHPGIVPVYGLGCLEDGRLYYAMRFVRGTDLKTEALKLHGDSPTLGEDRPTLPRLLRHFASACQAVAYANDRNVLHRDLKPEHIMLGPYGETLVVDWGLAMSIRSGSRGTEGTFRLPPDVNCVLGEDGHLVGSPSYMSPEQAHCLNSQLLPASDVYSLGATLYHVLTGRSPFKGKDTPEVIEKVKAGIFQKPSQVNRRVPLALQAVCLKAMAMNPSDRYASARELAREIERWLDDEPTRAYREPLLTKATRWARKHRTLTVGVLTLLLASSVATGLGYAIVSQKNGELALANGEIRDANQALAKANGEVLLKNEALAMANVEVRREKEVAEVARDEAKKNFDLARTLVNKMLFQVSNTHLPRIPGADQMRLTIAGDASQYLATLMKQRPSDPNVRFESAMAYRELGKVLQTLGRPEASPMFNTATKLLESLIKEFPDRDAYQDKLVEVLRDRGEHHRMAGELTKAETFQKQALAIAETQINRDPRSLPFQQTLARVLYDTAGLLADLGKPDEARVLSERAIAIITPLVEKGEGEPTLPMELAMAWGDLGITLARSGKFEEAIPPLDEAIRKAEALLAKNPNDRDLGFIIAAAMVNRGRALAGIEARKAEAGPTLAEAVSRLEKLARNSPDIANYRRRLAEALSVSAEIHVKDNREEPAREALEKARALLAELLKQNPGHPVDSGLLGGVTGQLARLALARGDREEARRLFEEAVELRKKASTTDTAALERDQEALKELGPAPGK